MIAFPFSQIHSLQMPYTERLQAIEECLATYFEPVASNVDSIAEARILCIEEGDSQGMNRLLPLLDEPNSLLFIEKEDASFPRFQKGETKMGDLPPTEAQKQLIRCAFLEEHPSFYARVKWKEKAAKVMEIQRNENKEPHCDVCSFGCANIFWTLQSLVAPRRIQRKQALKKRHFQQIELDRTPERLRYWGKQIQEALLDFKKIVVVVKEGTFSSGKSPSLDETKKGEAVEAFQRFFVAERLAFALLKGKKDFSSAL